MRAAAFAVGFLFAMRALAAQPATHTLLLELWLNGRNTHRIAQVGMVGADLELGRADANAIGLRTSATGKFVRLSQLAGITAQMDESNQRLLLTATAAMLKPQIFDLRPSETNGEASESASGAMLDYDLSASTADVRHLSRSATAGAHMSLAVFTPSALFTTDGFAAAGLNGGGGSRLESALEFDDAPHARRLVLGDAISGNLAWSRAVRFGGIQYASDFALQPDLVTLPLPQFFGTAAVPSTVDVFSGAARLFEQDVEPGPFELNNLPVVTGGGTATVIVRDMLGRETTQVLSFYATSRLLSPGLTSFSLDAGFLRRDFGQKSFAYGPPMAMFTVSHGFSANLTFEAHGEASPHAALAGGGLAFGPGDLGAVSVDLAASHGTHGDGVLGSVGLEGWIAPVKFYGAIACATKNYSDIAALDSDPVPELRYELGAAVSMDHLGSLSAAWIGKKSREEPATDLVSASYSFAPGNGLFFGLTGLRDFAAHAWAAQAFISVPLGSGFASTNVDYEHGAVSTQSAYAVAADPDGGFGWRVMAQHGESDRVEAGASYVGGSGHYDGAVDVSRNGLAARADVSGALVLMGDDIFVSREPGGAIALVKTGAPDVRIYRENRQVATSDADGEALLTGLVPYVPNQIAIEPRDYPIVTAVQTTGRTVVPRRMSGIIIDLAPRARHFLMARIALPDGSVPPVGAQVDMDGLPVPLMVGRNGEVFFTDLERRTTGAILVRGKRCGFSIAPALKTSVSIVCNFGPAP